MAAENLAELFTLFLEITFFLIQSLLCVLSFYKCRYFHGKLHKLHVSFSVWSLRIL